MKKILALVTVFLVFERFMAYKIDSARRHARVEMLRKEKLAQQKKSQGIRRLAQNFKPWQFLFTQIGQRGTATS